MGMKFLKEIILSFSLIIFSANCQYDSISFINHKVKKKETLFSLSKKYFSNKFIFSHQKKRSIATPFNILTKKSNDYFFILEGDLSPTISFILKTLGFRSLLSAGGIGIKPLSTK